MDEFEKLTDQELEIEKKYILSRVNKLKLEITELETKLIGISEVLRRRKEKQLEENRSRI